LDGQDWLPKIPPCRLKLLHLWGELKLGEFLLPVDIEAPCTVLIVTTTTDDSELAEMRASWRACGFAPQLVRGWTRGNNSKATYDGANVAWLGLLAASQKLGAAARCGDYYLMAEDSARPKMTAQEVQLLLRQHSTPLVWLGWRWLSSKPSRSKCRLQPMGLMSTTSGLPTTYAAHGYHHPIGSKLIACHHEFLPAFSLAHLVTCSQTFVDQALRAWVEGGFCYVAVPSCTTSVSHYSSTSNRQVDHDPGTSEAAERWSWPRMHSVEDAWAFLLRPEYGHWLVGLPSQSSDPCPLMTKQVWVWTGQHFRYIDCPRHVLSWRASPSIPRPTHALITEDGHIGGVWEALDEIEGPCFEV
jgi:hypothetical protein